MSVHTKKNVYIAISIIQITDLSLRVCQLNFFFFFFFFLDKKNIKLNLLS